MQPKWGPLNNLGSVDCYGEVGCTPYSPKGARAGWLVHVHARTIINNAAPLKQGNTVTCT
jgi:hypothetical protein